MNGDDFPKINDDFQGSGERREVVMKFAQIYRWLGPWLR